MSRLPPSRNVLGTGFILAPNLLAPLAGIDLLLDEVYTRLPHQPHEQELLRRALRETALLKALLNDVLHAAATPQLLCLGALLPVLRDLLVLLALQCRRAGITLEPEWPEWLPSIRLDSTKLKQALLNLLNNALEATPRGGRVRVAVQRYRDEVQITIADTGQGLPAEHLSRIF